MGYLAVMGVISVLAFNVNILLATLRDLAQKSAAIFLIIDVSIALITTVAAYWILQPRTRARRNFRTNDDEPLQTAGGRCFRIEFDSKRTSSSSSTSVADEVAIPSLSV